ncbi:MAG: class I SAM-dependent methyltransferase [Rubrivivax sp.]
MSALEQFLTDTHDRHPGVTSDAMACLPVRLAGVEHASTYALLDGVVPRGPAPLAVLDLACGDGALLSLLAARDQPGLALHGLDFSAGELAAAARRLGGRARLVRSRAQRLPYADASFDLVLSHMALMLMEDADQMLAELRRVLRPGGVVAALVAAPAPASAVHQAFVETLRSGDQAALSKAPRFPGRAWRDEDGIRGLFSGFADLRIDEVVAELACDPATAWSWYGGVYELLTMSPTERARFEQRFRGAVAALAAEGQAATWPLHFRRVTARRG